MFHSVFSYLISVALIRGTYIAIPINLYIHLLSLLDRLSSPPLLRRPRAVPAIPRPRPEPATPLEANSAMINFLSSYY